jgi:hypothetical protein
MNVSVNGPHVWVTLSRRNLEHLTTMLDMGVGSPTLSRRDGDTIIHVHVEENDVHYRDREAGPGVESLLAPGVAA